MSNNNDPCPKCGEPLEYDEVDVGVGVIRGNAGCPACHWMPAALVEDIAVADRYKARERTDPHVEAVAREIQRLQAYTRTTQAAFDDLAVAQERNVWLTSRVDGLLEDNNRYLEEGRRSRRELTDAKTVNALVVRQLVTLREALEFYADENNYDEAGVCGTVTTSHDPTSVGSGPESETDPDLGAVAEQALQDVMGIERTPLEPVKP
jgi:hypothetical protein